MVQWMPKRQSKALELIQGERHSLSEITKITNIPKQTLGDLKQRNTPITKPPSGRPAKLSECHKRQIVFHMARNHQSRRLSVRSIIQDLQLQVHLNTLKQTLKSLGCNHRIA